ncbi:MAG TPA: hypothetical protein VJN18_16105 [Polyangiaceae bacterium]|nr:hypothetical protein [Polyangiaceae bacterium]
MSAAGKAALLLALVAALSSTRIAAAAPDIGEPRVISGFRALDRPTGMAEAGFGWLTLPGADVCSPAGCKAGDTSFELDAWQLYRQNPRLAFGAGLLLGLIPTTDAPRHDPAGIERDHSRRYLTLEGILRYYPYVGEKFELWLGLTGGLVVLSDRFVVVDDHDDKPLIGPPGVTIRTEGGTLGVAIGGAYQLSQHWSVGASLRVGYWFLPSTPATDPLRDKASVAGRNFVSSLGFNVAYRIPL